MSDPVNLTDAELRAAVKAGWLSDPRSLDKLDTDTRQRYVKIVPPTGDRTIAADQDPNTIGTFATHVKDQLAGLVESAKHPFNVGLSGVVNAHVNEASKAFDAYRSGDYQQAAIRAFAALVPVLGPGVANAAEELTGGKTAAALGDAVGIGLAAKVGSKVPDVARAVAKDLPSTPSVASGARMVATGVDAVTHPGKAAIKLGGVLLDRLATALEQRQPKPEPPAAPATSPTPAARQAAQTAQPAATTPTAASGVIRSIADLSPAEQAQAVKWDEQGVSPEKILQRLQLSRDFVAQNNLPTPDEAAKAVDRTIYESTTPRGARTRKP